MERHTEMFKQFVGRGRKGQAAFLPLGLLRGSEGVRKSGAERPRTRSGEAARAREVLEWKIFELPQELGIEVNLFSPCYISKLKYFFLDKLTFIFD